MLMHIKNVSKTYGSGDKQLCKAVDNVSFEADKDDFIVILGKSGSGKSTLLNIIGGLEKPDTGKVIINDKPIYDMSEYNRTLFRRNNIAYVFQFFNLVNELTAIENIRLPLDISRKKFDTEFAETVFEILEIKSKLYSFPNMLSGGERQRISIARALLTKPQIILADEPTGNLDSKTTGSIIELSKHLNKQFGQLFIVVTHDETWTDIANKIYYMKDGCLWREKI